MGEAHVASPRRIKGLLQGEQWVDLRYGQV